MLGVVTYFQTGRKRALTAGGLAKNLGGRVLGPLVAGAGLLAIAVFLLHSSRVIHDYFRPDWLDLKPIQAAGVVRAVVEPKALLVVVEYDDINNGGGLSLLPLSCTP